MPRKYRYIPLQKAKRFVMVAIANAMGEGKMSEPDARKLVKKTETELDYLGRRYGRIVE